MEKMDIICMLVAILLPYINRIWSSLHTIADCDGEVDGTTVAVMGDCSMIALKKVLV